MAGNHGKFMFDALRNHNVKSNFVENLRSHHQSKFFGRGETGEIGSGLVANSTCFGVSVK